ncbi:MAG TPA: DUF1501 domain-containing protein [Planctomycetaceae bacterium]|jgi:hypothetical protein|nr:DUF1501 domain-containing protein [Planctomycetaceae bacterium]
MTHSTPTTASNLPHAPTRRQLLQAGSIGLMGLGMADVARLRAQAAGDSVTKPRSVIFIFLTGGASQHDTFDMKPEGPSEFRGEFSPIHTATPGIEICEHFPRLARQSDRWSLVRSLSHPDNGHQTGTYIMLTGRRDKTPFRSSRPHGNDWPSIAAVAGAMTSGRSNLANSIVLPEKVVHSQQGVFPGQFAGKLGAHHEPWFLDMTDKPHGYHAFSGAFPGYLYNLHRGNHSDRDDWRFAVPNISLPEGVFAPRFRKRVELLNIVERQQQQLEDAAASADYGRSRQGVVSLLADPGVRDAFNVRKSDPKTLQRYGNNSFGWSLLMARRLVALGVNMVQVNLGNMGTWDLHGNAFPLAKNFLFPPTDLAISALLDDLTESGMLEETMVVIAGEFGRTPRIFNGAPNVYKTVGRGHWGPCQTVMIAGGGVAGGRVIGSSDKSGAYPASDVQTPESFASTIYHALGIPRSAHWHDAADRPYPVYRSEPIGGLFA